MLKSNSGDFIMYTQYGALICLPPIKQLEGVPPKLGNL